MNKIFLVLCLYAVTGCAPLTPSVSKSDLCQIPSEYVSRFDSVQVNYSSWSDVKSIMGEEPSVQGDEQRYYHCRSMIFTFSGNVLVDKRIE